MPTPGSDQPSQHHGAESDDTSDAEVTPRDTDHATGSQQAAQNAAEESPS
jgi:hypothetical protein